MEKPTNPESSVTNDIIRKVQLTLADTDKGEDILKFLRETEPIFMDEVNRFIQTEITRMRYHMSEVQSLYIGSVIGASYIAGFLIAREASHRMFGGILPVAKPKTALNNDEIDKLMDAELSQGKSYKQIAKMIKNTMEKDKKVFKKKIIKKPDNGKRLDIGNLE